MVFESARIIGMVIFFEFCAGLWFLVSYFVRFGGCLSLGFFGTEVLMLLLLILFGRYDASLDFDHGHYHYSRALFFSFHVESAHAHTLSIPSNSQPIHNTIPTPTQHLTPPSPSPS